MIASIYLYTITSVYIYDYFNVCMIDSIYLYMINSITLHMIASIFLSIYDYLITPSIFTINAKSCLMVAYMLFVTQA